MIRMSDPSVLIQLVIEGPAEGVISAGHANATVRFDSRITPIAMVTGVVEHFAIFPSSRQPSSTPPCQVFITARPRMACILSCTSTVDINVAIATLDGALLAAWA